MSGCSTSIPMEKAQDRRNHLDDLPESTNLPKTSELCPLQPEIEGNSNNIKGDSNGNENVHEDEDEDEDADFNPFLKDTNLLDASSSLSSEVEDLDADLSDSKGKLCAALTRDSVERYTDVMHTNETIEHGEEMVMQCTLSPGELCVSKSNLMASTKESLSVAQSENRLFGDKENDSTNLTNNSNAADGMKPQLNMDADGAICMRTRARYSLASFTLDELETFLQETDDEDDLQNVDDEEEYKKFLAAVLRGDESQNLQDNTNDDDDEENDADFEFELEEALESEPEEIEERRVTRRNRRQKVSVEHNKKPSGQLARPLRPLLPFASIGSFPTFDGKHLLSDISPSFMPSVSNGFSCGFTPHQIGQLHCLIHEHVQLLIQVFSMCVLEPAKRHTASQIKELIVELLRKRDQLLAWRTLPYPSFCFFPPYIHPSVPNDPKILQPGCANNNSQHDLPSANSKDIHPDVTSSCNVRPEHPENPADEQASSSQTVECTSWGPYICGPVLSVTDVAPLRLVENFMDDISSAVREHEQCQIELGFDAHCQKEPLFPHHSSSCSVEVDGQGEMENTPLNSTGMLSSSSNQMPKKTMAATLLEKAKNQPLAIVPKEISKLAQRFQSLFNPALYPHKPPPAPLTNRVLFTDAEDELLALGLMEYNTDWKAIQQRFLPCKSRHQIFVRQKNRASSKAPENPIKAVRRMKNSSLTSEEVARIELGLKKYKLDWISIWRFFVPYRDPSLLPRQWRIACGTQKSYKSDANKKAKRRLYELRRKACKPSASTWHSSSEKEGDSTDNAVEDTNSGDNHMDKEDEAYVHEAFLADWRPDTNNSSNFSTCLRSDGSQIGEPNDNSVSAGIQPLMSSKSSAALRSSYSQVVLRPYRARRANNARMVKLAPGLPPVNLPPSVRIMSQSAFQSSQAVAAAKNSSNASRVGVGAGNLGIGNTMKPEAGSSVKFGPSGNCSVSGVTNSQHPNHSDVLIEKCVSGRGDSDLQMHPLLFQTPQDGNLPYYPLNSHTSMSSSFTFFSGKQPQLSLSLFHNPRDIRDAVNFLSKSSKAPDKNASHGVDFHPLLQRSHDRDTNAVEMHPGAASLPSAKSRQTHVSSQGLCESVSKPDLNGNSSGGITKDASHTKNVNELDLDIHLCFTSSHQEYGKDGDMTLHNTGKSINAMMPGTIESESTRDFADRRNSAPDGMNNELDPGEFAITTSQDKRSGQVSETIHDDSLPEIIMEQEELSDSEEEFGENVEFEQEEMADSDDSTSESEQFVNILNEVCEPVADIDDHQVENTWKNKHENNTCGTSDGHSIGKGLVENVANVKHDADSVNLNSHSPSSRTNSKKPVVGYEFGPFGTTGGSHGLNQIQPISGRSSSRLSKPGTTVDRQKRVAEASEHHHLDGGDTLPRSHPRKRVCESYSNSSSGHSEKPNLSPNNNVQILKKKKNGN